MTDEDDGRKILTRPKADTPGSGREDFLKLRCVTVSEFVRTLPPHINTYPMPMPGHGILKIANTDREYERKRKKKTPFFSQCSDRNKFI